MPPNSAFFDKCMRTRNATPPTNSIICSVMDGLRMENLKELAPPVAVGTLLILFLYLLLQRFALMAAPAAERPVTPNI